MPERAGVRLHGAVGLLLGAGLRGNVDVGLGGTGDASLALHNGVYLGIFEVVPSDVAVQALVGIVPAAKLCNRIADAAAQGTAVIEAATKGR